MLEPVAKPLFHPAGIRLCHIRGQEAFSSESLVRGFRFETAQIDVKLGQVRFPSLASRTCMLILGRRNVNPNIARGEIANCLVMKLASTSEQRLNEDGWRQAWCMA